MKKQLVEILNSFSNEVDISEDIIKIGKDVFIECSYTQQIGDTYRVGGISIPWFIGIRNDFIHFPKSFVSKVLKLVILMTSQRDYIEKEDNVVNMTSVLFSLNNGVLPTKKELDSIFIQEFNIQ